MNRDAFLIAFLKVYATDLLVAGPQYAKTAEVFKEAAKRFEELASAWEAKIRPKAG